MKTAVVMLLSMAAISCAQDRKAEGPVPDGAKEKSESKAPDAAKDKEKKRLESVTWDLKTHKLIWVVEHGSDQNGQFVASGSDRYEITPDDAVMKYEDQRRGFTMEEASSLHKLLDTLSLYCAESVIWWNQGEGVPLDGKTPSKKRVPAKPDDKFAPGPNRQRVDHGDELPNPSLPTLVAEVQGR